jgi:hypothetical protein
MASRGETTRRAMMMNLDEVQDAADATARMAVDHLSTTKPLMALTEDQLDDLEGLIAHTIIDFVRPMT